MTGAHRSWKAVEVEQVQPVCHLPGPQSQQDLNIFHQGECRSRLGRSAVRALARRCPPQPVARLFPPRRQGARRSRRGNLCRGGPLVALPGSPRPPPAVGADFGVPSHSPGQPSPPAASHRKRVRMTWGISP